jgi:hypothetical protein
MKEIEPGKYLSRLVSPSGVTTHGLTLRVYDKNGNILDLPLGSLKVIDPLMIFEKGSKSPVEHARIRLFYYNYRTGSYEAISSRILPVRNPSFSLYDGSVKLVLPIGRYRAEVSAIRSNLKQTDFTIGLNKGEEFPAIYLDSEPFSPISYIRYQWETCADMFDSMRPLLAGYANSLRIFELNAFILLAVFVCMSLLAFRKRIKIPFRSFHAHFSHRLRGSYYSQTVTKNVAGIVLNAGSKTPLGGADIYLINPRYNSVLAHAVSRQNGSFSFPVFDDRRYVIEVMKSGYSPNRFHEDTIEPTSEGYVLKVMKKAVHQPDIGGWADALLSFGLEALLVCSFVLEMLFVYVFGWEKTAPFIALSLLNLFLVLLHKMQRDP